jgi:hypothetical protein
MKHHAPIRTAIAALVLATSLAVAGDGKATKAPVPPEPDPWQFKLAAPGWMAGLEGDVGIDGVISHVDIDPGEIIRHIDMAATLRAEASKGRFGITGDFVYLSLSDGVGPQTMVKKLDLQIDEIIGELGVRWRLLEGERGWLDVIGGVRYMNIYQKIVLQPNPEQIDESSTRLVDAVGNALRTALEASQLGELIALNVTNQLARPGNAPPAPLPIGPLDARLGGQLRERLQAILGARRAELETAVKAQAQAISAAARVAAQRRVDGIKRDLSREIARTIESSLDTRIARTDDWWDPYIGLRGRYNFTDRLYFTAKADVGGFGVGADLSWQAEAAFGVQLTPHIFAEAGYRALGIDYNRDGLIMNTITHGAQVTMGITF